MEYIVEEGKLIKCVPSVPEQIIEHDGVRVKIQTQELDLIIPEGVESISLKAFDTVKSYVETISLPASIKTLEGCQIKPLLNLKRIVINGEIKIVPHGFFSGLKELKSVEFSNPVNTIEESAFSKCKSLEQVNFSEGLERIEKYAFLNVIN